MPIIEFLETPAGNELVHAVVLLLVAISGWISYRTHVRAIENQKLLNGHLEQHIIEAATQHVAFTPAEPPASSGIADRSEAE